MKARNVFITGASSGIGKATAYKFAEYGDNLILCARRKENLNEIAQDIKNKWRSHVHIYELDVTNYEDVSSVVKDLEDKI